MANFEDNSISHDISTNAGFRAWCSKVREGLLTVGLVQTADVNQANLATIVTPSANSTYSGYDIFRFSDAAQGSDPVFIKVSYGRGGSTPRPQLGIAVGAGSDGFGNITNPCTTLACTCTATPTGNGRFHIHFKDGTLVIAWFPFPTSQGSVYSAVFVERLREFRDGSLIPGHIFAGNVAATTVLNSSYGVRANGVWNNAVTVTSLDASVKGPKWSVAFIRVPINRAYAPLRSILGVRIGALGPEELATFSFAGSERTYKRPDQKNLGSYSFDSTTGQGHEILLPFE